MQNWWIIRLFRESKLIFVFITCLCIGQWYFTKQEINSFPWFYWSMYSSVEHIPEHVSEYGVYLDGEHFNYLSLDYWSGIAVYRCTKQYQRLTENNFEDPQSTKVREFFKFLPIKAYTFIEYKLLNKPFEIEQYPRWLHGFLERKLDRKIQRIEIFEHWYDYDQKKYRWNNKGQMILKYESNV